MAADVHEQIKSVVTVYDHVIWDWNGTLLDDVDIAVEAVNVLLAENNLPQVNAQLYREVFCFPIKKYYQRLGFDFEKVSFETLCERFVHEYNVVRARNTTLFDGIPELLSEIKQSKKQSILSAATQWHLEEMTEHFDIHEKFDFRYGIDNHFATSKLERGRQLIRDSQVPAEKTILIGDTDHDFEVAKELGISCLLVADGHQTHENLSKISDKVVMGRRNF